MLKKFVSLGAFALGIQSMKTSDLSATDLDNIRQCSSDGYDMAHSAAWLTVSKSLNNEMFLHGGKSLKDKQEEILMSSFDEQFDKVMDINILEFDAIVEKINVFARDNGISAFESVEELKNLTLRSGARISPQLANKINHFFHDPDRDVHGYHTNLYERYCMLLEFDYKGLDICEMQKLGKLVVNITKLHDRNAVIEDIDTEIHFALNIAPPDYFKYKIRGRRDHCNNLFKIICVLKRYVIKFLMLHSTTDSNHVHSINIAEKRDRLFQIVKTMRTFEIIKYILNFYRGRGMNQTDILKEIIEFDNFFCAELELLPESIYE